VRAFDFPLLADENVHPSVIAFLREAGLDVESVSEQGKFGLPDTQVFLQATQRGRVVLTHDSDFGGLALMDATQFIGIIYIRPGHIHADFTIKTLEAIREHAPDVAPPFILVAERTGDIVKIRVRQV
jgi:predicted nuclease of predicted toxin-antitoxin system